MSIVTIQNPTNTYEVLIFSVYNINNINIYDTRSRTIRKIDQRKTNYNHAVISCYEIHFVTIIPGIKPNSLIIIGAVDDIHPYYSFYNIFNTKFLEWRNMTSSCNYQMLSNMNIDSTNKLLHSMGMRAAVCGEYQLLFISGGAYISDENERRSLSIIKLNPDTQFPQTLIKQIELPNEYCSHGMVLLRQSIHHDQRVEEHHDQDLDINININCNDNSNNYSGININKTKSRVTISLLLFGGFCTFLEDSFCKVDIKFEIINYGCNDYSIIVIDENIIPFKLRNEITHIDGKLNWNWFSCYLISKKYLLIMGGECEFQRAYSATEYIHKNTFINLENIILGNTNNRCIESSVNPNAKTNVKNNSFDIEMHNDDDVNDDNDDNSSENINIADENNLLQLEIQPIVTNDKIPEHIFCYHYNTALVENDVFVDNDGDGSGYSKFVKKIFVFDDEYIKRDENVWNLTIDDQSIQWSQERLLWMGFYKNDKNKQCLIRQLGKDVLFFVLHFLRNDLPMFRQQSSSQHDNSNKVWPNDVMIGA